MSTRVSLFIASVVAVVLAVGFGYVYFDDHAYGAWGDDSPGYVYLAGRMLRGESIVYQDELAKAGIEFFGDEKLARWLTPTHHLFISPDGFLASKYPIGTSLLMVATAKLVGSTAGFYIVVPLLAALNIALVYLLALVLFPRERYKHLIGVGAAASLGLSALYYDYAIAQPMREVPSMFFLLLTMIAFVLGVRALKSERIRGRWESAALIGVSALSMGMAFNIRETSLVVLPALVVYGAMSLWDGRMKIQKNVRRMLPTIVVFFVALALAVLPTILNSVDISQNKVAFKARDTGSVVLLSNIGHLETLSVSNIFNSEGKFRPGKGSLEHYWNIMQRSTPIPYALVFTAFGMWYAWKRQRKEGVLLVLWSLGILIIFSMWINPYSRYILPMFPPLLLLTGYGAVGFFRWFVPTVINQRWLRGVLGVVIALGILAGYGPVVAEVGENLTTDVYRFKAISESDLDQLSGISDTIQERGDEKPVLLFGGEWQYGISETLEAHTGLKTIRFPLDQKFGHTEERVDEFLKQQRDAGYTFYVWLDDSGSDTFFPWFEGYNREIRGSYVFTFQAGVRVYELGGTVVE